MKKKAILFLLGVMMLSNATSVFANEKIGEKIGVVGLSERLKIDISPKFMYTKEKTIVKTYASKDLVTESIYYEEYDSVLKWGKGTLTLISVKFNGIKYDATFIGTLYYSPQ